MDMRRIRLVSAHVVAILLMFGSLMGLLPSPSSATEDDWSAPTLIENTDYDIGMARLAGNAAGVFVAAWLQFDGLRGNVWVNRFLPGVGWIGPVAVGLDVGNASGLLDVAIDERGEAIVVWLQDTSYSWSPACPCLVPQERRIYANRLVPGLGWGTPDVVGPADSDFHAYDAPHVAVDPYGNAIVAWWRYQNGHLEVWANRYIPDTGWAEPWVVGTAPYASYYGARIDIAVNAEGDAVIAWATHEVASRTFRTGEGWRLPLALDSSSYGDVDVAMDPAGDAIAVWTQVAPPPEGQNSSSLSIRASRHESGAELSGSSVVDAPLAFRPRIGVSDDGSAVAVWVRAGSDFQGQPAIYANRFVPQLGWGVSAKIGDMDDRVGYGSEVSANAAGNAMVAWVAPAGTRANVWARYFQPTVGWESAAPVGIETPAIDPDGNPIYPFGSLALALDDKGHAVLTWFEFDGVHSNLWASRFVPSANPAVHAGGGQADAVMFLLAASFVSSSAILGLLYWRLRKQVSGLLEKPPHGNGMSTFSGPRPREASEDVSHPGRRTGPRGNRAPRRWPPNGGALRLTAKERILLHLFDFAKYADAAEVPEDLTPSGFADRVGVDRRHIAQSVGPLVREGLARERSARVKGGTRRRKVYVLTDEGRRSAIEIRDRLRPLMVRVRDASGLREATIAELLTESRGAQSILEILREWIEAGVVNRGGGQ